MANTARRTVPANERAEVVLYDHFFSYFHSERMFLEGIKYSGGAFPRGLPSNKELSSLSAAEIELFHEVIACECDGTFQLFSPTALRSPVRTQRANLTDSVPEEAKYQHEFYRCLYEATGGACAVSPEYGQTIMQDRGRIDFFIGAKGWGIELLHDGDRVPHHVARLKAGGTYHPWIQVLGTMADFIILDFHQTKPRPQQNVDKLFHIVYNKDFTTYEVPY
ncbi:hypothetical protein Moror_7692 [Moniliophthora roreri MCA 2997]|uniref:Uncharacterized protein n=1 Tax=Moniliophthora roreri (strain MCA 2997) TaxID=1381753 RepID=V2WTS8_MONRO|nr:hypothetical protein Moror_7692 [Moniliophthora roreri MCA 2997]